MCFKIKELIPKVPLLRTAGKRFPEILAGQLDPQVFVEADVVLTEGETGDTMYFIDRGLAEILVEAAGNAVVRLIADGCFFGEGACILKLRRTATIRSKHIMSVYSVTSKVMEGALADYPEHAKYLTRLGLKRAQRLEQLRVTAHLDHGDDILDAIDDEDVRTPLFEASAARAAERANANGPSLFARLTTLVTSTPQVAAADAYAPTKADFKTDGD